MMKQYMTVNVQMLSFSQIPWFKTFFFSLDLIFMAVDFSAKGTSRQERWWSSMPAQSFVPSWLISGRNFMTAKSVIIIQTVKIIILQVRSFSIWLFLYHRIPNEGWSWWNVSVSLRESVATCSASMTLTWWTQQCKATPLVSSTTRASQTATRVSLTWTAASTSSSLPCGRSTEEKSWPTTTSSPLRMTRASCTATVGRDAAVGSWISATNAHAKDYTFKWKAGHTHSWNLLEGLPSKNILTDGGGEVCSFLHHCCFESQKLE